VRDRVRREQHKAVTSPDKILTAFCQLGALRMKAKRALIFFFDVNHAYIMAEATQTLSLEHDGTHEPGDQLWLGYSVIPREVACCEVTVNMPSFDTTTTSGHYRDNCFVVDDLTKHPDFRLRNYVTEHPHGRYYAGVPITTPAGVNIGAYCILDDKPRSGISDQDLVFMRDMSQTVMTHLLTTRATSEREQNSRMVAGLGDFVRGTSNSLHTADQEHPVQETKLPPLKNPGKIREASRNVQRSVPDALIANEEHGRRQGNPEGPTSNSNGPARHTARAPDKNDEYKHTYQRGAETMCQSLGIDGVAILDLSVDIFGGLVKPQEDLTSESSITSESASDDCAGKEIRPCRVLGCAENLSKSSHNKSKSAPPAQILTETFVRRLMHRNPRGKIWSFGEDLTLHSDDGFSTEGESADSDEHTRRPQSPDTKERKYARRVRRSDADNLQLAFPGARCIALHGIWDHSRHRWSVAGLYWTYDPLRVISPENEMQFVSAFCDIMVAETNRVEVVTSDKAKSDFISSVSHELRSPLHGILGSVEVLLEEKLENTVATLVQQISTCGNSLLEIIDHLLDFANLRKHQVKRGAAKSSKIGRKFLPDAAEVPEGNLAALKTGIALDDLTEDAVSSSVYSFHFHHEGPIQTSVILDIERSESTDWICKLATGGWRRVVINLITNALKYTPSGFVHVTLGRKAKPGFRRRFDAVLSVADSGKGMSEEFQKNHLFEDFSQEDTLASGLGIGMHMVARIVNAMGGTIEVTSDQTSGTKVTVTVPIENTPDVGGPALVGDAEYKLFAAVKTGIIEVEHDTPVSRDQRLAATARAMAIASVEKNLEILGMKPEKCSLGRHTIYDLNVLMDVDLDTYIQTIRDDMSVIDRTRRPAILVICSSNPSARSLRRAWRQDPMNADVTAEFVALPCGLRELTRAIAYVLQKTERPGSSSADVESSDSAKEYPITPNENDLYDGSFTERLKTSLPVRPPASSGYTGTIRPKTELKASAMGGGHAPLKQLSSSFEEVSLLPDHHMRNPQDLTNAATLEQRPSKPPTMPAAVAQSNPSRPLVLLVDDNSINLQLLVRFAKKQRYEYITASDGKLALEAFENAHRNSSMPSSPEATKTAGIAGTEGLTPMVILMDINMPVVSSPLFFPSHFLVQRFRHLLLTKSRIVLTNQMDGYESLQRIRAYERKHHMKPAKTIAVTALGSDAARAEAFGSGFDLFVSKPIKLKDLAMLIE
jgi:signal transduction histidine kinase/CheY-like chemotaxis protein